MATRHRRSLRQRLRLPGTVLRRIQQRRNKSRLAPPRQFDSETIHVRSGRFAIVGDLQRTSRLEFWRQSNALAGRQLIHQIVAEHPDFLAIVGDLVLWGSSAAAWAAFDHLALPLWHAHVPILPLLGNHDYGYEHEGQRIPLLTFTEFVQRLGQDDRVQFFFLDVKIPEDRPDFVPPLFLHAVQTLQHYRALHKAIFLTPYETIFHQIHHEAQRWTQTTRTRVEIAFDTEGPTLIQLSAWPSAVRRTERVGARFALWGEPVVTVQSWQDFLVAELRRRDAVNATRPPRARLRFIIWTINDGSDLCALVGAGVDGIMTDDPGRLRVIVQHWGQPDSCPSLRSETTELPGGG